jgi:hypothetical protein
MKWLAILSSTVILGGCAGEPLYVPPSNQRVADYVATTGLSEVGQIRKGNSDSWSYVNDRYVVYLGPKDYLIEFRNNCADLKDNTWVPADYIHDHRNLRAREDTIRGCIIEKIYSINSGQRSEIRQLARTSVPAQGAAPKQL